MQDGLDRQSLGLSGILHAAGVNWKMVLENSRVRVPIAALGPGPQIATPSGPPHLSITEPHTMLGCCPEASPCLWVAFTYFFHFPVG